MEILLILIAASLVAHFLGDFVAQSQWMATEKSSSIAPLLAHILVYTVVLTVGAGLARVAIGTLAVSILPGLMWFGLLNGVTHLAVDFVSSRLSKWARETGKMRIFWIVIGADQLVHQLILLVSIPLYLL